MGGVNNITMYIAADNCVNVTETGYKTCFIRGGINKAVLDVAVYNLAVV